MRTGKGKLMKKNFAVVLMCMLVLPASLASQVYGANVRGGTISVRPAYTPGFGVNIPKQTIIGTTKMYKRPIGGIYPVYGGVYYSGVRYSSRRNRVATYDEIKPQQVVVREVYKTPPITSCNGLAYYDKEGYIIRCR